MSRHNSVSSLQSHHNKPKSTRRKEREKLLLFTKKMHTKHVYKSEIPHPHSINNRKASQHANTWAMTSSHLQHLVRPWTVCLLFTTEGFWQSDQIMSQEKMVKNIV